MTQRWCGLSGAAPTRWTLSLCSCTLHKSLPRCWLSWISETRCGTNSHVSPLNIQQQDVAMLPIKSLSKWILNKYYALDILITINLPHQKMRCSLTWKSLSAFTRPPTSFFREKITANFPRSWVDFGSSLSGLSSIRLKDVLRSCVEVLLSEYKTLKMDKWVKIKPYFFSKVI